MNHETKQKYSCVECQFCGWDNFRQKFKCLKNLVQGPHQGSNCRLFERYPGAEIESEETDCRD